MQLADARELIRSAEDGDWSGFENLLGGLAAGLRALSENLASDYFEHTLASRQLSQS